MGSALRTSMTNDLWNAECHYFNIFFIFPSTETLNREIFSYFFSYFIPTVSEDAGIEPVYKAGPISRHSKVTP